MIISLKNIYEIAVKDLKSFFDGLYGYILLFIFLALAYFMFLQSFFVIGIASLKNLFDMLPIYLIVFVPAVTMSSFSRESDKQTLEYILTKPLKTIEVVLGKIIACVVFIYTAILLTTPLYFTISKAGKVDGGETLAGYIAALLLVIALSTLGVAVSSFFKNQISAFLVSCFVIFALFIAGSPITSTNISIQLANIISGFAINSYYSNLIRGVLDLGDVLFFILFSLILTVLAVVNIDRFRIPNPTRLIKRSLILIGVTGLVAFWLIYLSKDFEYRLDLTQSKKYTLSQVTKDILKSEGKIMIDVYASTDLPKQFQYTLDEVRSQLKDYKQIAGNNIEIQYIDPKDKEAFLTGEGISPVQFNVIGDDQFQTKQGYLAMIIKNEAGDKTQNIPYLKDINNLEYQVMRLVNKVKTVTPPKVAFANGSGEYSQFEQLSTFSQILSDNFTIENLYIPGVDIETDKTKSATFKTDGYSGIIIVNPTIKYTDDAVKALKEYVNKGGKIIYAIDSQKIDLTRGAFVDSYEEGKSPNGELFSDLGIKINSDMVYDLKSRSTVTVGTSSGLPLNIQYPYFPILMKDQEFNQFMPENTIAEWPSSLEITDNAWKVIYRTTDKGGSVLTGFNLDPAQQFSQENLKSYPVAAYRDFDNGGRIIVLGSARMLSTDFIGNAESSVVFALTLSESMSQNAGLSEIKAKNLYNAQFTNLESNSKSIIRYGSPITSIVITLLIGGWRIYRRRALTKYILSESA